MSESVAAPLGPAFNLGRISGKLLSANLVRNGVDLTFRNAALDPDLLYLDVNNHRVGINTTPGLDFQIDGNVLTTDQLADNQVIVGNNNLIIDQASIISSATGQISFVPLQTSNPIVETGKIHAGNISIDDNKISSYNANGSIIINPNSSAATEILNDTQIFANLYVTGNINIAGNLSKQGNLIIGDDVIDLEGNLPENDKVDFNAPFSQSIIPGLNDGFDLGGSRGDSSAGRWAEMHVTDNFVNTENIITLGVTVSQQTFIDGVNGQIFAIQSNEDLVLSPDTGVTRIENTIIQQNDLVNLYSNDTPMIFASTGAGYYRFQGTNGIVVPAGTISERADYEVGSTRWNTDIGQLECFDGTVWIVSTGPGSVDEAQMSDLGQIYTLILG